MPSNSALHVQEGIPQPEPVSPYLHFKRKKRLPADTYIDGILAANRVVLSQAITLIESTAPQDIETANQIIEKCLPYSGNSIRIGITGVPGAGKSTFIEAFGKYLTSIGKKLAVLAVDPSSELSKGSILGDKTRMEELSIDPNAFIRPSPSGATLGGVARKTRETVILCEAAGFDVIVIETVGVGQSETVVKSMVDFFLLLMLSGAGDELQGIKRGIMEMADALIITKADGDNVPKATAAKALYQSALQLFPKNENGWMPPVGTCSVYHTDSIERIWQLISDFEKLTKGNGFFFKHRTEQSVKTFFDWMNHLLKEHFYSNALIEKSLSILVSEIREGKSSPYQAGSKLIHDYLQLTSIESP
ncbi:MAG: methylmalonyl Co-A mutase-associated GTPase MeaB [Bacteroidetes bacterium]|nr:methylmalonyl Co-A mutase-associated GTPase MeaB [Bacteroidota bacterium]MCL2303585.1 methylmalonyl Co-A mutase-associated GTPase MeaB [Lentimicrobiaceae bacterium]